MVRSGGARIARAAGVLAAVAWALALVLLACRLPRPLLPDRLDESWMALLAHDAVTGARFGADTVFTYGPLAWLLAGFGHYEPSLFWPCVVLQPLVWAAVAAALLWPAFALRSAWRFLWLGAVLLLAPPAIDALPLVAIGALGLQLVRRRRPWFVLTPACALLAVLALIKFTLLVSATAAVLAAAAARACARDWRAAGATLAAWVGAFLAVWLAAGQSPGTLGAWLRGSLEVATGYNEAMALPGDPRLLRGGILLAAALGALALCTAAARPRRAPPGLGGDATSPPAVGGRAVPALGAAVLLGLGFVAWKTGFVRQDEGHAIVFFAVAGGVAPLLVCLLREKARGRGATWAGVLLGGTVLAGAAGGHHAAHAVLDARSPWRRFEEQVRWNALYLTHAPTFRAWCEMVAAGEAERVGLPQVRATVGTAAVDLLTHTQGVVLANGLRLRHRPVFQSYSAYTPALQERNAAFFAAGDAPPFVLLAVAAIDGGLPMAADSAAWFALLRHYAPLLVERGHLLLQRRNPVTGVPAPTLLLAREAALGEWVELPEGGEDELRALALRIAPSILGRLRAFAFRPPLVHLDVRTTAGEELRFRIAPGLVRRPFLLDPLVRDSADFATLYAPARAGNGQRIAAVRVTVAPGKERWFALSVGFALHAHDRAAFAAPDAASVEAMAAALR